MMLNLLVVSNNPDRPSFRQRVQIHLGALEKEGIKCEIARLPKSMPERLKLFKSAKEFDGVFLQKKKLNILDAYLLRRFASRIIYDFDDAVMFDPESPQRDSFSHFRPFRRTAAMADMVIAGNSYLAEYARKFNKNVEVLPTGLDVRAYQVNVKPQNDRKIRLAWIGSKATLVYLEEVAPALEEIGKRFDKAVLRIICDDFFDLRNMEVEKKRWSLDTQALDLAECDIGLSPLPDNRFTRGKCGFKILQYAAAGLPIVTSPVGVNSDFVQNGVNGLLATDTEQWIIAMSRLIQDESLRKTMGHAGLSVAQSYDVAVIGRRLTKLVRQCLA